MRTRILLLLCAAGRSCTAPSGWAAESDAILSDELTVKSAGLPVDGAGLLEFFGCARRARRRRNAWPPSSTSSAPRTAPPAKRPPPN